MSVCVCVPQCLVWDHDSRGKHDFIGEFYATFREMQKISSGNKVSEWRGGAERRRGERQLCNNFILSQCASDFSLLKSSAHGRKKKMSGCFDMFKMPQVVAFVLCLSFAFVQGVVGLYES